MKKSSAFIVQFSGLKLGKHSFEIVVDDTFFEKLEYSPIEKGKVDVKIVLEKKSSMMIFDFKLNGWVGANCDRCTVEFNQQFSGEHQLYVKFGDDFEELDDNLLVIPRESYQMDVSQLIYEFIELNVPLRAIPCEVSDDTTLCDQETLKVLEEAEMVDKKSNPLWAELNKIKDQLKD
ncbi:MAG: hypothetical protein ACI9EQ_002146 [Bacteroidia bacterium]|jgi:uncharacterized protein